MARAPRVIPNEGPHGPRPLCHPEREKVSRFFCHSDRASNTSPFCHFDRANNVSEWRNL
jgi:hypothetical protein